MDVEEAANAADGVPRTRSAVFGAVQGIEGYTDIETNVTNSTINTTKNIHDGNSGWWMPTSTIVTAPTNTDVMNQLCRVCGEPAAGFHFGAFTCEGCKSFFGRTYNNLGSISGCKNGGVCVINKKNRTACKACRLRKCLMVGMSKSGSRYGRRSNWFKIHCLLQEQSHRVQQAISKNSNEFNSDKVPNSLDAANNNDNSNSAAVSGVNSGASQSRLSKVEESIDHTTRVPMTSSHGPFIPDAMKFPLWHLPSFVHPATINPMQFLNTPYFPFPQRFIHIPYLNQVESPHISVPSLSISSSESASPRSTPSPKTQVNESFNVPNNAAERIAFYQSLGPEQEEPMDLSKNSFEMKPIEENDSHNSIENIDESSEILSNTETKMIETETVSFSNLCWKT